MRNIFMFLMAASLSGCNLDSTSQKTSSDIGRYQMQVTSNFIFYRIDTKTGEVVHVNVAPKLSNDSSANGTVVLGASIAQ